MPRARTGRMRLNNNTSWAKAKRELTFFLVSSGGRGDPNGCSCAEIFGARDWRTRTHWKPEAKVGLKIARIRSRKSLLTYQQRMRTPTSMGSSENPSMLRYEALLQ